MIVGGKAERAILQRYRNKRVERRMARAAARKPRPVIVTTAPQKEPPSVYKGITNRVPASVIPATQPKANQREVAIIRKTVAAMRQF